jgi:hypothetical protein
VERVAEILEKLEALGKARELDDGRYVAVWDGTPVSNVPPAVSKIPLSKK